MTDTLAPSPAPVIPLRPRVPAPAEDWVTPSYCGECHRNHPGPCGCPCHFPSEDQVAVLAMVFADLGYGAAFARSQSPEDGALWLPVAALLESWGCP